VSKSSSLTSAVAERYATSLFDLAHGCSLLAESAVSLEKFDEQDLERRINEARDVF